MKKCATEITLRFRVNEQDANRIRGLADLYAEGNLSLWLLHAGLNAPRKMVTRANVKARGKR